MTAPQPAVRVFAWKPAWTRLLEETGLGIGLTVAGLALDALADMYSEVRVIGQLCACIKQPHIILRGQRLRQRRQGICRQPCRKCKLRGRNTLHSGSFDQRLQIRPGNAPT